MIMAKIRVSGPHENSRNSPYMYMYILHGLRLVDALAYLHMSIIKYCTCTYFIPVSTLTASLVLALHRYRIPTMLGESEVDSCFP